VIEPTDPSVRDGMSHWRLSATCEHGVSYRVSPQQLSRGHLPPCTCKAEVDAIGRRGSWFGEWRARRLFHRELRSI
jgi:hypothetical protein